MLMLLFHGPTLSSKDLGMQFRKQKRDMVPGRGARTPGLESRVCGTIALCEHGRSCTCLSLGFGLLISVNQGSCSGWFPRLLGSLSEGVSYDSEHASLPAVREVSSEAFCITAWDPWVSSFLRAPDGGLGESIIPINALQTPALSFGHSLEPRGPNFPIPFMPLDPSLPPLAASGFFCSLEADLFLTLVLSSSFPLLWPSVWEMIPITVLCCFFFLSKACQYCS